MECMAGGSLETRLQEQDSLPAEEAVRVALQVCEGLAYAHQRGVVHCDLKPANILFTGDGTAKVSDFGIAHVSGETLTRSWMTPAGFVAGTLPYMSPEQTEGMRDNSRLDVYALGAALYRMLTGRPYLDFDQRETPAATASNVMRIQNEQPKPPSTQHRRVDAWLDAVVLKALAKRPEDQYATPREPSPTPTETPEEPTATLVPTGTYTSQPTRTTTPVVPMTTRPPSSTPDQLLPPPSLVEPEPDAEVRGQVLFKWAYSQSLPPTAAFQVLIWREGAQEHPGAAAYTAQTEQTIDLDVLLPERGGAGYYFWTVVVVNRNSGKLIGKEATARPFRYPGPAQPGGPPTATKTKPPEVPPTVEPVETIPPTIPPTQESPPVPVP
jgi:serine/threonine protein kinase